MRLFFAAIIMMLLPLHAAQAEVLPCPDSIDVASQDLAKKVSGWRYFSDTENTTYLLDQVSLGIGKGTRLTPLNPDKGSESTTDWKLRDNGKIEYMQVCSYTHTSIKLKRVLSEKFKSCHLSYEKEPKKPGMRPAMHHFVCE